MFGNKISRQLIDIIRDTAVRNRARRIRKITLVAGDEAVISQSLLEHFALMSKGTPAEGALVEIRKENSRVKCEACRIFFKQKSGDTHCPRCGKKGIEFVLGKKFFIESLKIEV